MINDPRTLELRELTADPDLAIELDEIPADPYGWELQLDLYGCDRDTLTNPAQLKRFVEQLIIRIGMVAFGEFECPHFGHTSPKTAGYSFKQWIETSLISGHEANGNLYLNVFSCVEYDEDIVIGYAMGYFNARRFRKHFRTRY